MPVLDKSLALVELLDRERSKLRDGVRAGHKALMPIPGALRPLEEALGGVKREEASVSIFVGPEGGFTEEEVRAAEDAGVTLVTLGPRILRAETAAVAALTMTLYELGEMGERET